MDVLFYQLEQVKQSHSLESCLNLLDASEQARAKQQGESFAYIRSELKRVLAQGLGLNKDAAAKLTLKYGEHGKPFCEQKPDLHFNLSHSHQAFVIALDTAPIGVDIEWMKPRQQASMQAIAARIFSKEQIEHLAASNYNDALFYAYWCSTEAIIKQRGESILRAAALVEPFLIHPESYELSQGVHSLRIISHIPHFMVAVAQQQV